MHIQPVNSRIIKESDSPWRNYASHTIARIVVVWDPRVIVVVYKETTILSHVESFFRLRMLILLYRLHTCSTWSSREWINGQS